MWYGGCCAFDSSRDLVEEGCEPLIVDVDVMHMELMSTSHGRSDGSWPTEI